MRFCHVEYVGVGLVLLRVPIRLTCSAVEIMVEDNLSINSSSSVVGRMVKLISIVCLNLEISLLVHPLHVAEGGGGGWTHG